MTSSTIKILVADDHAIIRKGIAAMLAIVPDIELVGTATNGREAVAMAEELNPDVILMDLVMPEMDGIEAIRRYQGEPARGAHPGTDDLCRGGQDLSGYPVGRPGLSTER